MEIICRDGAKPETTSILLDDCMQALRLTLSLSLSITLTLTPPLPLPLPLTLTLPTNHWP